MQRKYVLIFASNPPPNCSAVFDKMQRIFLVWFVVYAYTHELTHLCDRSVLSVRFVLFFPLNQKPGSRPFSLDVENLYSSSGRAGSYHKYTDMHRSPCVCVCVCDSS